jgi:hypothetical protein
VIWVEKEYQASLIRHLRVAFKNAKTAWRMRIRENCELAIKKALCEHLGSPEYSIVLYKKISLIFSRYIAAKLFKVKSEDCGFQFMTVNRCCEDGTCTVLRCL